jgi:hypothetical protein
MTSMLKFGCTLALLFFSATASAQGYDYDELAGQVFWVRPTPEVFRRLEFYRQPNLNAVSFYPQGKKSFRIVNVTRGWIKLNFINSFSQFEEAFLPLGYLKRNTYSSKTYNEYAFKRATFFNEDPDGIQERAKEATMSPASPTAKTKSTVSKFFRHKKKIDAMNQANRTRKKTPVPQQ